MAFSWTETINIGSTLKASHLTEIRDNTDSLATSLSISNYSWSTKMQNLSAGSYEDFDDFIELRDGLDYIHDNNVCSTDNSSNNSGDDVTHNSSDNDAQCSGDNDAYNSGDNSGDNTSHDNSDKGTYYTGNNIGDNGTHYNSDKGAYYTGNNAGN